MNRKLYLPFGLVYILIIALGSIQIRAATIEDQNISIIVEINGKNLRQTGEESSPIYINPDGTANITFSYEVESDSPLLLERIRIVFLTFNLGLFVHNIDETVYPGSKGTFTRTVDFGEYLNPEETLLDEKDWKFNLEFIYSIEENATKLKSKPFHVSFGGDDTQMTPDLLGTVMTGATLTSTAIAGVSAISLVLSTNAAVAAEISSSIASTTIHPLAELAEDHTTEALLKQMQQKLADACQKETQKFIFDRCPSCRSKWSKKQIKCSNCGISLEEAKVISSKQLEEKCVKACGEISRSVSGMRVLKLAQALGTGVPTASSIIKICSKSGLSYVKPYTGNKLTGLRKKIVFTGLSSGITGFFWFQKLGMGIVTVIFFVSTVIFGLALPIIIRKLFNNRVRLAVQDFWKSEKKLKI